MVGGIKLVHKWYVVQVVSGLEKKVKKNLEEFLIMKGLEGTISEVLVPTENVSEVVRGEQKISEKKLWPGYILLKMEMTDEACLYVKNTNGVLDFLGGGTPTPLTDREVQDILSDLAEKKKGVVQKHKVEVGDKVKVTDGVFVNFVGTVTEVFHDKGRVSVMVSIFGRDTRVDDLEFWQIEQVNEENQG